MVKLVKKESSLDFDGKKPCKILNLTLSDFSVTKHLLIAHSGGIQVDEQDAIRTLSCDRDMYGIRSIMVAYSSDLSLAKMKKYFMDHPKAILELNSTSDAFISSDSKSNFTISDIRRGNATLHVWREKDTEVDVVIKEIATLH